MTEEAEGMSGGAGALAGPAGDHGRLQWLREARLGMFIHWGLYSMPARHEWVKERERLGDATYDAYFRHFDPDLFEPRDWARQAAAAGMRYVVVTTKHHEGFCLWDSALTDYKATNTPARRDLLRPIIDAFRAEGLRIGLYHSLLDWHHPEFPIDGFHPQRDDAGAVAAAAGRDVTKYADYLHGQVEELLTQFGRIDYLWFDFSYPGRVWGGKGRREWRSEELVAKARAWQPDLVLNDRLDIPGEVTTPEQYQPDSAMAGDEGLWEACQTLNGSWGYDRDNLDWKPPEMLVRMLIDGVSKGGNLLLNVGPNSRGQLEPRARAALGALGQWTSLHGRSIYGAGPAPIVAPPDCRVTQRGDRIYVHIFAWPFRHLHLRGLAGRVDYAQLLHDGSEIGMEVLDPSQEAQYTKLGGLEAGVLTLTLPVQRPEVAVPVIELFLRKPSVA